MLGSAAQQAEEVVSCLSGCLFHQKKRKDSLTDIVAIPNLLQ